MPFVIDSSFAIGWLLKETDRFGARVVDRLPNDQAWIPTLWWYEVRNVLLMAERRRRISAVDVSGLLRVLAAFQVDVDQAADENSIFLLARQHSLTFYDAAYLELALRRNLPPATLDADLADAARVEQVLLVVTQ